MDLFPYTADNAPVVCSEAGGEVLSSAAELLERITREQYKLDKRKVSGVAKYPR